MPWRLWRWSVQVPSSASTCAFDERPIDLGHGAVLELRRNPLGCSHVSGEDDRTGHRPVEPMGQAEVDVAFLRFALAVERLHADLQAVDAGGRLREHAGGLVDHEHRAVVVEDVERFGHCESEASGDCTDLKDQIRRSEPHQTAGCLPSQAARSDLTNCAAKMRGSTVFDDLI